VELPHALGNGASSFGQGRVAAGRGSCRKRWHALCRGRRAVQERLALEVETSGAVGAHSEDLFSFLLGDLPLQSEMLDAFPHLRGLRNYFSAVSLQSHLQ